VKSTIISAVSILVFVLVSSAFTTTYYVNGSTGNDAWDGLAAVWDGTHGPKKTIQAGINVSAGTDTVSVADGTYTGAGNKDLDFGGKAITLISQGGAGNCIIDCGNSGRGFYFHTAETSASVVDGFKITSGNTPDFGGGIYCNSSSPTIWDCTITGNQTGGMGGGIYCCGSSPTITNCVITGNSADAGGGITCLESPASFTDCVINANTANFGGGIMLLRLPSPSFANCTVSGNTAYYDGGGGYCMDSSPTIANCLISGNVAWRGGAIMFVDYSSPAITNCTITGNTGSYG
jgi:parallel beta-helix repeat protein